MTLKIRPSMRTTYRKCPKAFFYRWVGGVEPARGRKALVIGSAYHAGLEDYRLTRSEDHAAGVAVGAYSRLAKEAGIDPDLVSAFQVEAYVRGYALRFGEADGGDVVVEAKVFDDGDPEGGTADCVVRRPDGSVWLIEDKTTARFDHEESMAMALRMNDQVTTYVAALKKRGIPVQGVRYRQVLKTGTSQTKKETIADYADRIVEIYTGEENAAKYREIVVTWTDAELRAVRESAHALNRQIRRQAPKPLAKWPANPLSCIGPYGACEYIKLCARGRNGSEGEFKETKEGSIDGNNFRNYLFGKSQGVATPSDEAIDRAVDEGYCSTCGGWKGFCGCI